MKLASIFFFFLTIFSFGQKPNILVEYDYSFSGLQKLKAFLAADESQSIFFFSRNPEVSFAKEQESNFSGVNPYFLYYYDFREEIFYERVKLLRNEKKLPAKLSWEALPTINWKIKTEQKKVLGLQCFLAEAEFRGRKFKAWFAPKISTNAFPLKLKGLPGLILEFEDSEKFVTAVATKITVDPQIIFPEKIQKIWLDNKSKAMKHKDFIELENETLREIMEEQLSALAPGTRYEKQNVREMSLEKSFEWEEPKKP